MMELQDWMKRPEVTGARGKIEKKSLNAVILAEKLAQQIMTPKSIMKIVAGAVLMVIPITALAEYRKASRNEELLDEIAAKERQVLTHDIMLSDRLKAKEEVLKCDRADFDCEADANDAQIRAEGLDELDQVLRVLPDTVRVCREQQLECLSGINQ